MKSVIYYACRNPACQVFRASGWHLGGPCWRCGWMRVIARIETWR